mgnify:CR=1 FL=1
MTKGPLVSVKMPEALIQLADDLVKMGLYKSRSDVVRAALWDLIKKEHPKFSSNPLIGVREKEEEKFEELDF